MTGCTDLTPEERKHRLQREITLWVGNQRLDQAMKREELAQLEGVQRHLALSKSLIPNVIRLCRREKRADTRMAVLVLITLLSDNNNGMCVLTIKRMAELLSRSENSVRDSVNSLEGAGLISVNRTVGGLPNSYWPNVPAVVATMNPAMVWFVDALSKKPVRKLALVHPQAEVRVGPPPGRVGGDPQAEDDSISLSSAQGFRPDQTIGQSGGGSAPRAAPHFAPTSDGHTSFGPANGGDGTSTSDGHPTSNAVPTNGGDGCSSSDGVPKGDAEGKGQPDPGCQARDANATKESGREFDMQPNDPGVDDRQITDDFSKHGPGQDWSKRDALHIGRIIENAFKRVRKWSGPLLAYRDEVPTIRAGIAELEARRAKVPKKLRSEEAQQLMARYDEERAKLPEGWKPPTKKDAKKPAANRSILDGMSYRERDEWANRQRAKRNWAT
jgi:hypothetical protein